MKDCFGMCPGSQNVKHALMPLHTHTHRHSSLPFRVSSQQHHGSTLDHIFSLALQPILKINGKERKSVLVRISISKRRLKARWMERCELISMPMPQTQFSALIVGKFMPTLMCDVSPQKRRKKKKDCYDGHRPRLLTAGHRHKGPHVTNKSQKERWITMLAGA